MWTALVSTLQEDGSTGENCKTDIKNKRTNEYRGLIVFGVYVVGWFKGSGGYKNRFTFELQHTLYLWKAVVQESCESLVASRRLSAVTVVVLEKTSPEHFAHDWREGVT